MTMTPNRPRPSVTIPHTPPPMYATNFSTPPLSTSSSSSTSYFSPASPNICTPRGEREIMMGGLVSRVGTPRSEGDEMEWDEKRQGSIEVPSIVLTEPLPDLPPRTPSPPPKHILLLPPASLPIPDPNALSRPVSPAFLAMMNRKQCTLVNGTTIRSVLLLGAVALGAWHLWYTLDVATLLEDVVDTL